MKKLLISLTFITIYNFFYSQDYKYLFANGKEVNHKELLKNGFTYLGEKEGRLEYELRDDPNILMCYISYVNALTSSVVYMTSLEEFYNKFFDYCDKNFERKGSQIDNAFFNGNILFTFDTMRSENKTFYGITIIKY